MTIGERISYVGCCNGTLKGPVWMKFVHSRENNTPIIEDLSVRKSV